MADNLASMRRKVGSAADLQSVVRAMKAQAAGNLGQYEKSVAALRDYMDNVETGLGACLRRSGTGAATVTAPDAGRRKAPVRAVIFGSDQGLVGNFNEQVLAHALAELQGLPGGVAGAQIWAVGQRIEAGLRARGLLLRGSFAVPRSVTEIAALASSILAATTAGAEPLRQAGGAEVRLFHNRPTASSGYAPVGQRLLPLDCDWRRELIARPWPPGSLPEVIGELEPALRALIDEYLFISTFRACAESQASENASRLAAMDRADRNIDKLLETLDAGLHRLRQAGIDEELSDVIAGFLALETR